MDIYNRIIEAIAEKLVSIRLDEVTWAQLQAAKKRMAAKKAGRAAGVGSGHEYGHSGERTNVRQLTGQGAGVRGGDRFSHDHPQSLATGTEDDPWNRAARNIPIKPEISKTEGPKGGKQGKRGVES